MEIVLTFRGTVRPKAKALESVWSMRQEFSRQLSKLWGKEPFAILKRWEDTNFEANAPRFIRTVGDQVFVPFFGKKIGLGTNLEIELLKGVPNRTGREIKTGDLDNRVKRVIDALRAPTPGQKAELLPGLAPNGRWYCLLDDDNAVTGLQTKFSGFLASDDPTDTFVIVRARTTAFQVTMANIGMLL